MRDLGLLDVKIDNRRGDGNTKFGNGALAGRNAGTVIGSYATGEISGFERTGGLIGESSGLVMNSHTNVLVRADDRSGGLVGTNTGMIINSHANGEILGDSSSGGLVSRNGGKIINSYATGNVTGNNWVGGLVGYSWGSITNSYATGAVLSTSGGPRNIGGLVGLMANNSKVTNSYTIGNPVGGALIGSHEGNASDVARDVTYSLLEQRDHFWGLCGRQRQNNEETAKADHCDRHLCELACQRLGFRQLFAVSGAEICSKPRPEWSQSLRQQRLARLRTDHHTATAFRLNSLNPNRY